MEAYGVLQELWARGVVIRIEGESLIAQPSAALTDELRAAIKAAKPELMQMLRTEDGEALIPTGPASNTARSWQCGLHERLHHFAALIECARRGLIPPGPMQADGVTLQNPQEWVLKSVERINVLTGRDDLTRKERRKLTKASRMLEDIETWVDTVFWDSCDTPTFTV